MVGVAEGAVQVASAEADEYARGACVKAFALK